jgi:hypothetical protein
VLGYFNFWEFWLACWGIKRNSDFLPPGNDRSGSKIYWSWICAECRQKSPYMLLPSAGRPTEERICDATKGCEGKMEPYVFLKVNA